MKDSIYQLFIKKHFTVKPFETAREMINKFSLTERAIFAVCTILLCLGAFGSMAILNDSFMIAIPVHGGTLTEGIVGLPRFINPLLVNSDADRDLTALVYSGLLKATPDGTLIPDLAQSYTISTDGLSYTFILKPNLTFHDGTSITADDVVFTIQKAQDPSLKSPKRANWEGVQVEKINDREVKLTLKQPYSPFLENATLGILPKHIWGSVDVEEFSFSLFNTQPIGSGPYKVKSIERNGAGIPIYYRLESFSKYVFNEPYIKTLILRFFQNSKALIAAYQNGTVQSIAGISADQAEIIRENNGRIERTALPRIFAVFFNQNQATVLSNKEVRQALNLVIDKDAIVKEVLNGYGIAIDSPIPPGLINNDLSPSLKNRFVEADVIAKAKKILEDAKWKWNADKGIYERKEKQNTVELAFSISTSNAPELKALAEALKTTWAKIGVRVDNKVFDIGELNQNVIRPRKYDALLFGEIIGRDLDLFAFWHSSQRNDPGLNIALYTNSKADKLLEDARNTTDRDTRLEKYRAFETEIQKDIPAIFIYSPDFLYAVPYNLQGFDIGHITVPAERFLSVEQWYTETEHVWKVFTPAENSNNL